MYLYIIYFIYTCKKLFWSYSSKQNQVIGSTLDLSQILIFRHDFFVQTSVVLSIYIVQYKLIYGTYIIT